MNQLFSGESVEMTEMLAARENRVKLQRQLLDKAPHFVLLSATMAIPGAVKTSTELEAIFNEIITNINLAVSDVELHDSFYCNEKTGYEYFLLLPLPKEELKKRMIKIEETHRYGRLVDLDVLWLEVGEVKGISREALGYPKRKCFICEEEAKVCGRSRKHSVQELQQKISERVKGGRMQEND